MAISRNVMVNVLGTRAPVPAPARYTRRPSRLNPLLRLGGSRPSTIATPEGILESEYQFVDDLYSGGTADTLAANRNAVRTNVGDILDRTGLQTRTLLDRTFGDLGAARTRFSTGMENLIGGQAGALEAGRSKYFTKAQADLEADAALADVEMSEYEAAERAAGDLAVADAFRSNKAMFAKTGAGASSYADRLAAGIKLKSAADLAQRVAARRTANRLSRRQAQASLDASLTDRERADVSSVYGDRMRFLDALTGQERSDTGLKFTSEADLLNSDRAARLALERDVLNQEREDLRYLIGEQGRFVGTRKSLLPKGSTAGASARKGRQVPVMGYDYF